ncbi:MAG: DUF1559 domain-containing protein [Rubripirellula sp.]
MCAKAQARRTQCAERLRRIAFAALAFENSKNRLPGYYEKFGEFAGGVDPADPGNFGGNVPRHAKIGTWQVALLANMGNAFLYERWAMDHYPLLSDGSGERGPTTEGYSIISASSSLYECPSASGSIAAHGLTSYIANVGMHADVFPFTHLRPGSGARTVGFARSMSRANGAISNQFAGFDPVDATGAVPVGKRVRMDDFKDGATNTMLFTENNQAQPWYLTRLSGNVAHLHRFSTVNGDEVTEYPTESRYLQGAVWHYEDDLRFAGAPVVQPRHKINGGDPYSEQMNSINYTDLARPSSLHVAGVNMAMADGSVHYVSETMDYRAYQALLTPNGRSIDMPNHEYLPLSDYSRGQSTSQICL